MQLRIESSCLSGAVSIPGSKSHTIRAVAIAALAEGTSRIEAPLESADARSAVETYRALGAQIRADGDIWLIEGTGGALRPPDNIIDVGNSGTTLRIALGSTALLGEGLAVFTGDHQIRSRPAGPLARSLTDLGASVRSTRGNGCAPFVVEGRLTGGETSIEAITSQYLTSLLMCAPLAEGGQSIINVPVLYEKPYVEITLDWLERQGITVVNEDFQRFCVAGGQRFKPVERRIPGDFSSATFFLAAGALGDNAVVCEGLDLADSQGDKAVVDYLRKLGAKVEVDDMAITVRAGQLTGCDLDLNATPDALPMMAALACFAKGRTRLLNVPQARLKETDRIAVMRQELSKLGARIEELEDGLVVEESDLHGGTVMGHDDHRVVMALAVTATMIGEPTVIDGYEAVRITYPGFVEALQGLGGAATVE